MTSARGTKRRRSIVRAGDLVRTVLSGYGVEGAVREHRLVTEWESIVGARVAARAWPDGLRHGVLYIRVTNSAWMHELGFLGEAMVREANRVVGDPPLVTSVRLHLGSRRAAHKDDGDDLVAALAARQKPRPSARPLPRASAGDLERIDREADRVEDAELREVIRDVRRRLAL